MVVETYCFVCQLKIKTINSLLFMKFISFGKRGLLLFGGLLCLSFWGVLSAQEASSGGDSSVGVSKDGARTARVYKPNYWYVGAEFFSPLIYDDLYSWVRGSKFNFGKGVQLKGGYQFSSVFGLEVNVGVGQNYLNTSSFQKDYVLGLYDAYTYYPYTLIDGTTYTHYYPKLVGEQGNNPAAVQVEGVPFSQIRSRARFIQTSLNATVNLTRLFYSNRYTEKPVELWLKPGVYLSRFRSQVYNTTTGRAIAPRVNRSHTWGAGGDLSVRFNLSPRWALDLTNRLIWERDHSIDGVLNAKRAYDSYIWEPAVGLVYKFRRRAEVPAEPALLPVMEPKLLLDLAYWYPEEVSSPALKQRSHSAAVYLTYILNKTFISPELHNNPSELARLEKEMKLYLTNPDYTVRSIRVEGFASPEGPYDNNMRLAEGRARSIIDYIVSHTGADRGLFTVGRMSENWDGLRDTLQKDASIPGRDRFLELLSSTKDTESIKARIQRIPEYKELLANVYPHLRLSSFTVDYEVRTYKTGEAKELIRTNPSMLSAEEMYSVACHHGLGTAEGDAAIAVLKKHYPGADLTLSYEGVRLLQSGAYGEAVEVLSRVQHPTSGTLNALGVAHAYLGHVSEAKRLLTRAATDNADARSNLLKITRTR